MLDDGSTRLHSFEYNPLGKPTQMMDPVGRTTLYNYATNHIDLLEVRQVVGDTNELLAAYSYNQANQPLTVTDASGQTTAFGYLTNGLVAAVTNALGETLAFEYDANHYLTNIAGPVSGAKTSFTHDGYGRVRTVSDSENYTVTTDYDTFDRPTKVTYPDDSYEQMVYKWLDPVLSRDRLGRWSSTTYDAARRPVAVQDAQGRITSFDWCRCGSLNGFTDPMGRTTSWTRDLQGRITNKTYPDNSFLNYIYENKTSRLKEIADPLGQRTIYSYFKDGNIQQIIYSNAVIATPSVSFTYSTNYHRLLTMTDGIGTTVYDYHPITDSPALGAGRLASVDGPLANDTITYAYDELGRTKHQAIDGVGMQWSFDALGRVTGSTNALGAFTNSYIGVTPRVDSVSYPNGQTTTFDYFNNLGDQRLKTIWNRTGAAETLSKFDYTYDVDGRISTWTQQLGTVSTNAHSYGYDRVNQLLSATVKDANTLAVVKQFVYGYDKAGNRTSEQINEAANLGRYNEANQLTNVIGGGEVRFSGQISEPGTVTVAGSPANMSRGTNFTGTTELGLGTNVVSIIATDINTNIATNRYELVLTQNGVAKTLRYDINGNLTNTVTAATTNHYEWDAVNRLLAVVTITETDTNRSEFTYDGLSRRVGIVEKTNGVVASEKRYLWLGSSMAEERDATGATVTKRFFGQGEQQDGTNYFYTRDHLGSIRELTDADQIVQARYDYDPYGRRTKLSGTMEATFGYTGHFWHENGGFWLTWFRAYDPDTGRWISRDPIAEEGGLNLYAYVLNDPINAVDPTGLFSSMNTPTGLLVAAMLWGGANAVNNGVQEAATQAGKKAGGDCFDAKKVMDRALRSGMEAATEAMAVELAVSGIGAVVPTVVLAVSSRLAAKTGAGASDDVVRLFHQGNLRGGQVSGTRALSTSPRACLQI